MAGIPSPRASAPHAGRLLGLFLLLSGSAPLAHVAPVWYEDDARDIPEPAPRDPGILWSAVRPLLFDAPLRAIYPPRIARDLTTGEPTPPASAVNTLGEVPNSTWFTNRIGMFPMTPAEAARGPGPGTPAAPPWTVTGGKLEGASPGFEMEDSRGVAWFVKFDNLEHPGMTTSAGVISARILFACGYNVPEDGIAYFHPGDLVIGEDATIGSGKKKRPLTRADLDAILALVPEEPDGRRRALVSRRLEGTPIGPFKWSGTRKDDPNDHVDHNHRRELRGLKVIAGWLNHFDTKQQNTLDMYVEENGRRFVRHHLIDFASTLGARVNGPEKPTGMEYELDLVAVLGRTVTLGLHENDWRNLELPDSLGEIGYFESTIYDPDHFKPAIPNAAFDDMTTLDGYWAAKVMSGFTDEILEAIVATGLYRDPRAAEYMTRVLADRRDETLRFWFERIPPLDFFVLSGGVLRFQDLAEKRNLHPGTTPRYRVRVAVVDEDRDEEEETDWIDLPTPELRLDLPVVESLLRAVPEEEAGFLAFEVQVRRQGEWSDGVTAYASRRIRQIVAVER